MLYSYFFVIHFSFFRPKVLQALPQIPLMSLKCILCIENVDLGDWWGKTHVDRPLFEADEHG